MVASCHHSRAACVADTLRDALHANEFTAGVRAGIVAAVVALALALVWRRVRPNSGPLPIAGLAAVAAGSYALHDRVGLSDRVLVALALLAVAGLVIDVARLPVSYALAAAIPGAVVLDSAAAPLDALWVRLLVILTTVIGGAALTSFDRRWARHGLALPLVAMWAFGAYVTLPDTELALALIGAAAVVALVSWPLRLAALGASGALPLAGLVAWIARFSGTGRPSSIVGAVAAAGVVAIEPAARALRRSGTGPIDVIVDPARGRWWTMPAVAPIQLALVFVAARVAGLSHGVDRAVVVVGAEAVCATAIALLITSKYIERPQSATHSEK